VANIEQLSKYNLVLMSNIYFTEPSVIKSKGEVGELDSSKVPKS